MDEFQVLESLNPVPGDRGNPGPVSSQSVERKPRRRVRAFYVAAAVAAFCALLVSLATLNRQPEERLLETVDPQAEAATSAVQSEETPTPQTDEDEPKEELSVVGSQPDAPGELSDESIARLVIPSIELDVMVREGVDVATLRSGPGHYPFTPLPGQPGNAALAGHRTTYGAPFHRLDEMEPGDLVSVTTRQGTFGYRVQETVIVDASDISVLGEFGDDRLTLTAAHPKYSADQLIVVTASLLSRPASGESPASDGKEIDETKTALLPTQVVAVGDRYFGLAWSEQSGAPHPENHSVTLVASDDGLAWLPVIDAPTMLATSASLAQHEGQIHIVGLQIDLFSDAPEGLTSYRILHHSSVDLQTWDKTVEQLPPPSAVAGRLMVTELAAADFGVVVGLIQTPSFSSGYAEVADQGFDPDTFCDSTGTASSVTFRVCGTTETIRVRLPESDAPVAEQPTTLVLSRELGQPFVAISDAEIGTPLPFRFSLYATKGGIGLTSNASVETSDGVSWTTAEAPSAISAVGVARGDERLLRSTAPLAGITVDGVRTGMAYSSDGEAWTPIDLEALFGELPRHPVHFSDVQAGAAGWAMTGQRKAQIADFPEIDRAMASGPSDFTITSDGFTLEGRIPFGPAVLRDPDDQAIREWDHLEMARPDLGGFDVGVDQFLLRDDTGKPIVGFSTEAWMTLHEPNGTFVWDVFFSPDGLTWSIIDSSAHHPFVAVGSEEVLIGQRRFLPAPTVQVSFTTVPTPGG